MQLHIGLDDTDSRDKGMCTTYLGALILEKLIGIEEVELLDYPLLVRLNPNIPHKTRGNGSVVLRLEIPQKLVEPIKNFVLEMVEKYSVVEDENTNPGVVFLTKRPPKILKDYYKKCLSFVSTIDEAEELAEYIGAEYYKFKNGRGIIGSLAGIGCMLDGDYTYELISYRTEENFGKNLRNIDRESVLEMNRRMQDFTFNNTYKKKINICPRGPDPVFCGIRGEDATKVSSAFRMIKPLEPVLFYTIFRTNQGTDVHYTDFQIGESEPYISVSFTGAVETAPKYYGETAGKRHVHFVLKDETGKIMSVAYEPTREFRKEVSELKIGDEITAFGAVRPAEEKYPLSFSLEKFRVNKLSETIVERAMPCAKCSAKLESVGQNKGFRCKKCGAKYENNGKMKVSIGRTLENGKIYVVPNCALRHLTKPLVRYGRENKDFDTPENLKTICFRKFT
ncbi:MAG: DUF1743 domain-containing protein [Candidatus Diapherotrites archaeon]|nr:DUF1743 domain-containing protein [Candidatus Diapherotrites archaeon]